VPGHEKDKIEAQSIAVTDDWPEDMPITEAEIELFERYMLDFVTAMIQHD